MSPRLTRRLTPGLAAALALAACATNPAPPTAEPAPPGPGPQCDAARVQAYLGREASAQTGAAILSESGANRLRWGPPRSAWTMDYRPDRVNVRYDDAMTISEITCG